MGIGIITNFQVNTSKNIDERLGPYADANEATASIDPLFRYPGLTVVVTGSGQLKEYWFNPTTRNDDLVIKQGSSGGITDGTYNPTVTLDTNITTLFINNREYIPTPTGTAAVNYTRVGNTVTVWGSMQIEASAIDLDATFEMSLPVNPGVAGEYDLVGYLIRYEPDRIGQCGTIRLVVGNRTAKIYIVQETSIPKDGYEYWFNFTYRMYP